MWEEVDRIIRQATTHIVNQVANFLPGVVVSLALLVGAVIVAALARRLVARAVRGLDSNRRAEQLGLSMLADWSASRSPSQVIGRIVQWTILILGLLFALTALDATMPSQFALSVFQYLPHLLAALLIFVVGSLTARFLARSLLISAVNMQIHSARLLSLAVKWLVQIVAVAMALDHLGIGRSILLLAFGLLFGGIVLAMALAIGLGAKETVERALERQFREPGNLGGRRSNDKLDHV
jgi:Conserved TM helix